MFQHLFSAPSPVGGRSSINPMRSSIVGPAVALGLFLTAAVFSAALDGKRPTEGFSANRDGLPERASDAWQSTVLVAKSEGVVGENARIRFGTNWGSGLVLQTGPDASQPTGWVAYVVTNAHVVRCDAPPCRYVVGFNSNGSHRLRNLAQAVEIIAEIPEKDLAFLKVAVPDDSKLPTPILGGTDIDDNGFDPVVAVGWPNLTLRQSWGVLPPSNRKLLVRRYSRGQLIRDAEPYLLRDYARQLQAHTSMILHNADILPGNSGGPLIDARGRVIGINDRVVRPTGNGAGLGYCCVRADFHTPGRDCVHLAIASGEILSEFSRIMGDRTVLARGR
jgi:S1-C subfamily serine protease